MGKTSGGFTLIELLVVIAIIGVLASIVLASLNTARQKSRDARRIADIKQLQLALELNFDTAAAYSVDLASLSPTYIPIVPKDPLGAVYTYQRCSNTVYHLGAALEELTNPALKSDSRGDDSGANIPPPTGCTAWGADNAVCSAGTQQGSFCYDVFP